MVFAGNVGDEHTLVDVVDLFSQNQAKDENRSMTRVGWIGLGAMGLPMARSVARAGHEVSAYDRIRRAPRPSPPTG